MSVIDNFLLKNSDGKYLCINQNVLSLIFKTLEQTPKIKPEI